MEFRRLGRTGLEVSRLSLGSGGSNRLGQKRGLDNQAMGALVREALDLGINFFDTSPRYADSELVLGEALAGVPRRSYHLATKFHPGYDDEPVSDAAQLIQSVETSLRRLRTDTLDVLFLHSVTPQRYEVALERLLPAMVTLRERGDVRFLGVTESPGRDPAHITLLRAVAEGHFDVVMAVYNMLNQSAEWELLSMAAERGIGVVAMTAVRRALADSTLLAKRVADAVARGSIAANALPTTDPLGWLVHGEVTSIADAAYRFASEPAKVATVLTGTADIDHLRANVRSVLAGPLPHIDQSRLRAVFGDIAEPLAE